MDKAFTGVGGAGGRGICVVVPWDATDEEIERAIAEARAKPQANVFVTTGTGGSTPGGAGGAGFPNPASIIITSIKSATAMQSPRNP